jgi:hypothetical protein
MRSQLHCPKVSEIPMLVLIKKINKNKQIHSCCL